MIITFKLLSFILIVYGFFKVFNITYANLKDDVGILFVPKEYSIRKKIELSKGIRKEKGFSLLVKETIDMLKLLDKTHEFPIICFSSFVLSIIAVTFCMATANLFLIVPLVIVAVTAPFVYIRQKSLTYKKVINNELETALSIITNSYIRSDNIVSAVEENIEYIHKPVKSLFQSFVFNCDYIDSDVKRNLVLLKNSLHNEIFNEWCNTLIACQSDSKLKGTLLSTVKKLSNIRIVSVRLDNMLYQPVKEFIMMVLILFLNIPIFYALNKEWYKILVHTQAGHIIMAAVISIVVFCALNVAGLTRPIEYRR